MEGWKGPIQISCDFGDLGFCQSHPPHTLHSRVVRLISLCDFPILQDSGDTVVATSRRNGID